VVTAQDEEIFWILYLVGKKKADSFQRLLASVDIVTEEQVVCFRRKSAILEQPQQVVILAMNITANLNLQKVVSG
jgi:hypothetical protein